MVEKGDRIEYKVLKKEPIVEPDDPDYDWGDAEPPEDTADRINQWYDMAKREFESFEHHEKSDLFKRWRNYHAEHCDKTIKLPDGSNPDFDNDNNMVRDLIEALDYRVHNFGDDTKSGWKIFNDLCGDYELTIVDNEVAIERQRIMMRWLKWLNEAPELTAIDPLTNEVAVGIPDNDGKLIYYFPQGINNTAMLHYKVYEEVKGKIVIDDMFYSYLKDATTYYALLQLKKHGNIKNPLSILGSLMQIPLFEGQHELIKPKLDEAVETATKIFESGEEWWHYEEIVNEISKMAPVYGESKMAEITKEIAPRQLINRVTDEPLLVKLQANRPPASETDNGGNLWPKYKGGKFLLRFTNNSFDILTKATGRKWGWPSESCETWNGCAGRGPCSDVKFGNCVIWIFEMDESKEYPQDYDQNKHDETGRIMIRWGDGYDKQDNSVGFKVGIEPGAYPKRAAWTKNMIKAIGLILKDEGLFDYHKCITPYSYRGYSDYSRGRGQIDYRGLKYRSPDGYFYDLTLEDVDLYLLMAQDPLLNKFQASDVLQLGSEPSRMQLAQNQAVWAMPDRVRWLVRWGEQSGNVEEVINFLLQHEVIQPDLVAKWVENLPAYEPNYQDTDAMNNIVYTIMNHQMLDDNLQRKLRESHDGFVMYGDFLGTFDEIMYLKLSRITLFENISHIPLVKAPSDVLESIAEMVLAGDFSDSTARKALQQGEMDMDIRYAPPLIKQLFYDSYDYLASVYALISAPNLSLHTHTRLIQSFSAWYGDNWKGKEDEDTHEGVNKQIQKVVKAIQSSIVYPLREQTDWGYHHPQLDIDYGEWTKEWRFQVEDKQNLYSVMATLELSPNDEGFLDVLMTNIRSREVYKYLWDNRDRYNINPIKFTMDMEDRNYEGDYTPNKWVTSKLFMKAVRESHDNNLSLLKYSFVSMSPEVTVDRTTLPHGTLKKILKNPSLINKIGVKVVATWLVEPEEFIMFENFVFKQALGNRFVKGRTRNFLDYPEPTSPEEWYERAKVIENLSVLEEAACGGHSEERGLSVNPAIPTIQQMKLVLEPEAEPFGDSKWRAISQRYQGDYSEYLNIVVKNLIKNPSVSSTTLSWILENHPEYKDEILANPNAPLAVIDELMDTNPFLALSNEGLSSQTLQTLANYILDNLLINPPRDLNRLKTYFYDDGGGGGGMDTYMYAYMRDADIPEWSQLLSRFKNRLQYKDWLQFWRGGTYKKGMQLPNDRNMAPHNPERERPMALVDEPILIKKPHAIYSIDIEESEEHGMVVSEFHTRYIEEVEVLEDSRIHVAGRRRPARRFRDFEETYQNVAEMYGWSPPEDRDDSGNKWEHDIVFVVTDEVNPADSVSIPEWRLNLTTTEINEFASQLLKHPNITEDTIIEIATKCVQNNNFRINTSNDYMYLYADEFFKQIGRKNQWTPKIIKELSDFLIPHESEFNIRRYKNVKPTNLMRDIAMGENEELLQKYGYDDSYALRSYREWVLNSFKDTLPIDFIYMVLNDPDASEDVRDRAMTVRNLRIREFLEYLQQLSEQEEVEDVVMEAEAV